MDKWATLCNELRGLCHALTLTSTQRQALEDLRKNLAAQGDDMLFAVRSSSPEEDLASASFAGGYETRLGVRPADLNNAVRYCFALSLDERVLVYKKEHGFVAAHRVGRAAADRQRGSRRGLFAQPAYERLRRGRH